MSFPARLLLFIFLQSMVACSFGDHNVRCYYFDPEAETTDGPGTSPGKAFRTLDKLNEIKLKPGDSVLLRSGSIFNEQLCISCKGDSLRPVVIGKYGGEALPHIMGDGSSLSAVHVFNSEYLIIRDLEISNRRSLPVPDLNGLLIELKDFGKARGIIIEGLFIHDVMGSLVKEDGGGNAIMIRNFDDKDTLSKSSRFDGLEIRYCHIKECQRNGIIMWGNWIRSKWDPSLNVKIHHNLIEGVPGDGIMPSACHKPIVEYNVMRDCPPTLPPTEACDGIWPWSCDSAIIQFNMVSDHKSHVDAYGFDSDWNSNGSLFQYNLSYNNDGGFLLVCNPGGWPSDWSSGNCGTVARFNVSINDGIRNYIQDGKKDYFSPVIHITGPVYNTIIENNLFYLMKKTHQESDRTLLSSTDWFGYADSTVFRNNFCFFSEPHKAVETGYSSRNYVISNSYTGLLKGECDGFSRFSGPFDKNLWYDPSEPDWDTLIEFLKDKSVIVNGVEIPVLELIGAYE